MQIGIEQKQTQSQVLGQQLQQALFLLKMNALELNDYLGGMVVENPVLEMTEPENLFGNAGAFRVRMGTDVSQAGQSGGMRSNEGFFEIADSEGLKDELLQQLDIRGLEPKELLAAKTIIDSLDDRSYFTEPLSEIERLCDASAEQVQKALEAVQSLDPAGVGARSLQESLRLQLERRQVQDPCVYKILDGFLEELAHAKYAAIAAKLHISVRRVKEYAQLIKNLWPGVSNDAKREEIQYVYPEITIVRNGDDLEVQLDERRLPKLTINPEYRKAAEQDKAAKDYLKEQYIKANRIVSSLELWKTMLRRVAEKIVTVQKPFFLEGKPLAPMRLADLAEELGVNVSTVSRAVAGKYLICDRGVFSLKHFFVRSLPTSQEKPVSSDYVHEAIRELLEKDSSLSDSAMTRLLNERGINIARRTVAKYRMKMGIAPVYRRKQKV